MIFNLFGKKKVEEDVAVLEPIGEKSLIGDKPTYSKEILQIHNEFETASDRLLEEAREIISNSENINKEKTERLLKFGFHKSSEVLKNQPIIKRAELTKEQVDLIYYYRKQYPDNKFITENQVEEICKKYGLIIGELSQYKGFVPNTNLRQLESFKLKEQEDGILFTNGLFAQGVEIRRSGPYYHIYKKGTKNSYDNYSFQSNNREVWYGSDEGGLFNDYGHYTNLRISNKLQICAPFKDMDMSDRILRDGYKSEKVIPDPIILHTVKGGFLVITKWGPEAEDPILNN